MMISASSIEHILAFDRARWSVMRKQTEGKGMGVVAETSRMDFGDGGGSAIPAI